jgi:hypothetical protein
MEKRSNTRAGWAIPPWCAEAGYSRATLYNLPPHLQPHSVKIRSRRIITESPSEYLARIRALQESA